MERYLYKAIRVDGEKKKGNHILSKFQDTLGNPNFFYSFLENCKRNYHNCASSNSNLHAETQRR